jgi:hypothetical protein
MEAPTAGPAVAEVMRRESAVVAAARAQVAAEDLYRALRFSSDARGVDVAAARRRLEIAQLRVRDTVEELNR